MFKTIRHYDNIFTFRFVFLSFQIKIEYGDDQYGKKDKYCYCNDWNTGNKNENKHKHSPPCVTDTYKDFTLQIYIYHLQRIF